MSYEFYVDASKRSERRNRTWYQKYLLNVLYAAKEKQARDIDNSIILAEQLMMKLNEKVDLPKVVPPRTLPPMTDISLMKPIPHNMLETLYSTGEKGATEKYLKQRNTQAPEDKFYFRAVTSWDYGWQQKQSGQGARDVNRGRCAILRDTFYRRNNLAPDPRHYSSPSGGEFSICSEYSCNPN